MRYFVLAAVFCVSASAQFPETSADFPAGTVSARLTLNLSSPPETKDRFDVDCSTGRLQVTLVTPDGRRINSGNASAAGFDWSEAPLKQPDWGKSVVATFRHTGQPGDYAIEISGQTTRAAKVTVSFFSPVRSHESTLRSAFPGAIVSLPVLAPEAIEFAVKEDDQASLIDVLVSDPALQIVLVLPGGETVTPESAASQGFEWKTTDDPFTQPAQVAGLLFPQPGRHHVIYFKQVSHGTYQVRALASSTRAEFRALFLPYQRGGERYLEDLYSRKPEAGKVSVRFWNLLPDCFAGDPMDIAVGLEGDTIREPPSIQAFYESPTRTANLTFVRRRDGRYYGTIVPTQPGLLHLTIRANGQTTSGVLFSDERQLPEILVKPRLSGEKAARDRVETYSITLPASPAGVAAPAAEQRQVAAGEEPAKPVASDGSAGPGPGCPISLLTAAGKDGKPRQDRVVLSIRIDGQGRAHDATVVRSPNADLSQKAIEYVIQCGKYQPGPVQAQVEVIFRVL